MVDVAQLVEPWIVIPVVAGSNPVIHPIFKKSRYSRIGFFICYLSIKHLWLGGGDDILYKL